MLKHEVTYSTDKSVAANLVTITAARAFEVIAMNKRGEKPDSLLTDEAKAAAEKTPYNDILGQDITRFDKKKRKNRKPEKSDKSDKTDKSEKSDKPDKSEKAPKKPRRQRPRKDSAPKMTPPMEYPLPARISTSPLPPGSPKSPRPRLRRRSAPSNAIAAAAAPGASLRAATGSSNPPHPLPMRKILPAIAAAAVAMAAACSSPGGKPETVTPDEARLGYSDFATLPGYGWRYDDTVTFVTPSARGEMRVAIRHSTRYPYRNVWLEVTRLAPDSGATPVRDTIELELADPFGLWKGTGVGPTRQMEAVVEPQVKVDSGTVVALRHIMRLDTLPSIEQTGIFIIE